MAKCSICGKGVVYGQNVSHSNRKTNRTWKPNIRKVKAIVDGTPKTVAVCSPERSRARNLYPACFSCRNRHPFRNVRRCRFLFFAVLIGSLPGAPDCSCIQASPPTCTASFSSIAA